MVDFKKLSSQISIIENELKGSFEILANLTTHSNVPVIGFTGPPGAGKSTLLNQIIQELVAQKKKIGVLAIDPSSPFTKGAILGDRIRMQGHFNHPNVFIRSLASRGSLGGLSAKTIEITDLMRHSGFDYILVETVGVGQSEVEIANLADLSVLVLVPEAGDEIQTIKAGVLEIADIVVVNKADREGADTFANHLKNIFHAQSKKMEVPVIKTVATTGSNIPELLDIIIKYPGLEQKVDNEPLELARIMNLIQARFMKQIDSNQIKAKLKLEKENNNFNLYKFVESIYKSLKL